MLKGCLLSRPTCCRRFLDLCGQRLGPSTETSHLSWHSSGRTSPLLKKKKKDNVHSSSFMGPLWIPWSFLSPPFIINPMWQNPHPTLEMTLPDWQSLDMTGVLPNSSLIEEQNRFFPYLRSQCVSLVQGMFIHRTTWYHGVTGNSVYYSPTRGINASSLLLAPDCDQSNRI